MDKLTKNWHKKIVSEAELKLNRPLSSSERLFIESRGSYIALEMIEDSVNNISKHKLSDYLNSEISEHGVE